MYIAEHYMPSCPDCPISCFTCSFIVNYWSFDLINHSLTLQHFDWIINLHFQPIHNKRECQVFVCIVFFVSRLWRCVNVSVYLFLPIEKTSNWQWDVNIVFTVDLLTFADMCCWKLKIFTSTYVCFVVVWQFIQYLLQSVTRGCFWWWRCRRTACGRLVLRLWKSSRQRCCFQTFNLHYYKGSQCCK